MPTDASSIDAGNAPEADRDLVGDAYGVDDKLHLVLFDRRSVDPAATYPGCGKRPPFPSLLIEIARHPVEGSSYPASVRVCPPRGRCAPARSATLTLEIFVVESDGGSGHLDLTLADGRVEHDTFEYDYCYR